MKDSNMQKHIRSREDIVAAILEIASSKVRQTMIMYRANLSYSQLRYYLDLLRSREMLERQGDALWLTMPRGRDYLRVYAELQQVIGKQEILENIGPSLASSA